MSNGCDHETEELQRVENPSYRGYYGDGEDDDGNSEYIQDYAKVSAFKDLDTHRYQCTLCKEVFYYSGRAKDHYEGRANHSDILFPGGKP